jgi:cytidine deaminase
LYKAAKDAAKNAYAPYSKFKVGAAVLTAGGEVFTGVNIENSSYPAGICAERSAFAAAISAGERGFEAIAVCAESGAAWPCGVCRQFMYEFGEDIRVISGEDEDHLEVYSLDELLPKGFRLDINQS